MVQIETGIVGMLSVFMAATATIGFTVYPDFVHPKARIEMVRDLGPVLELVVSCRQGSAIMSFSKVDKLYCTPKWVCFTDMDKAALRSCR